MNRSFTVNGETREWRAQTIAELLAAEQLSPDQGGVAVARNAEVVPRGAWADTAIAPSDRIEIVRVVRGG